MKPGERCEHDQPIFGECPECENEYELALDLAKGETINKLRASFAAMTARAEEAEKQLAAERAAVEVLAQRFWQGVLCGYDRDWISAQIASIPDPIAATAVAKAGRKEGGA